MKQSALYLPFFFFFLSESNLCLSQITSLGTKSVIESAMNGGIEIIQHTGFFDCNEIKLNNVEKYQSDDEKINQLSWRSSSEGGVSYHGDFKKQYSDNRDYMWFIGDNKLGLPAGNNRQDQFPLAFNFDSAFDKFVNDLDRLSYLGVQGDQYVNYYAFIEEPNSVVKSKAKLSLVSDTNIGRILDMSNSETKNQFHFPVTFAVLYINEVGFKSKEDLENIQCNYEKEFTLNPGKDALLNRCIWINSLSVHPSNGKPFCW